MVQWACITVLAVIAVVWPFLGMSWYPEHHDTVNEIMLGIALLGWLNSLWTNNKMLKQRLVLLVFLGYTVWIVATNQCTKLVALVWNYESIAFGVCVILALILGRTGSVRS